jgi:ribosomal protein L3 glutamine methyltransferase
MPSVTPRQLIAAAATRFRQAGLAYGHGTLNAADEAAWLMVHALRCRFEELDGRIDQALSPAVVQRAQMLFDRRIAERIPAAYITREAWLGEHRFYVDERVIVPRSYIAELLRDRLRPWLARTPATVLDLCTGSGCLAIVAAHTYSRAQVDAVDLSAGALAVARRNVRDHRLVSRLRLLHSDLFSALPGRRYDLIISNPPYVGDAAMLRLPAEYRHEPELALHGGRDGLDLVRRILAAAPDHLAPRGWLVMEVGHYRARVERAFPRLPFIWAETSGGDDCVLLLQREALLQGLAPGSPPRPAGARLRRPAVR